MRVRAIHQMLAGFTHGDAISNQAVEIQRRLQAWGYPSRLFAHHRDPNRSGCEDYRSYRGDRNSIVIYHHSIGSAVTEHVKQLPDRIVIYYHNITPAHFLHGFNARLERELANGRTELAQLRDIPYVVAASEYNALELVELGFAPAAIVPYFVAFDQLSAPITSPEGRDILDQWKRHNAVNWLFVGRLVPNKRQDDVIRLFAYYQRWIRPQARLLLIGSDVNAPTYRTELEMLLERWQVPNVFLPGVALGDQLAAYYRSADVFVCLSEHEGFCVPLLEAMALDVPVVAYAATGVPYTLGSSGVLLREKRLEVAAEMIELLLTDEALRRQVLARQKARLQDFTPQRVEDQLRQFIQKITLE